MSYVLKTNEDYSILLEMIWDLLDKYAIKNETHYRLNYEIFKKIRLTSKDIQALYQICHNFYKETFIYYIQREITYKNFMIVLKQICSSFDVPVERLTVFQHNKALNDYLIYLAPK